MTIANSFVVPLSLADLRQRTEVEAAFANVTHIAQPDALVTVDWVGSLPLSSEAAQSASEKE